MAILLPIQSFLRLPFSRVLSIQRPTNLTAELLWRTRRPDGHGTAGFGASIGGSLRYVPEFA